MLRYWGALITNLSKKVKQRNALQHGFALQILFYISHPIHGLGDITTITEEDLIEPFRIPPSRTHLLTNAFKQMEFYLLKKYFLQLQQFFRSMQNIRHCWKRKLLQKVFVCLKKRASRNNYIRFTYQKSREQHSKKWLSRCWYQWKCYSAKRSKELRVSQAYTENKRRLALEKTWALWRTNFVGLTREQATLEEAINHRNIRLLSKGFQALVQTTQKIWVKNNIKKKGHLFFQRILTKRIFNAWNSYTARMLHLNAVFQKRVAEQMKLKRLQCFKEWNELVEEVTIGREAFFHVKTRKVFRCLEKINEFYKTLEDHADFLAKKFKTQNMKKHFTAWNSYVSKIVAKNERNSSLFRKFQLSIKTRCFKAFKSCVMKKVTNKKCLWTFVEKRTPKIMAKIFKALASYSTRKARNKTLLEKLSSQKARKLTTKFIKTLYKLATLKR